MTRSRTKRKADGSSREATVYTGPIRLPTHDGLDRRTIKQNLAISQIYSSSATGVITGYFTGADVTACTDWASFANVYSECRVLGFEWEYVPYFNGTYDATRLQSAGAVCVSHVPTSAAPATIDDVVSNQTWKPFRSSEKVKVHWKFRGIEEAGFVDTASPSSLNQGAISWYLSGLSNSSIYGRVVLTWLVEFRGRK